jgi:hypothetical protein
MILRLTFFGDLENEMTLKTGRAFEKRPLFYHEGQGPLSPFMFSSLEKNLVPFAL